MSGWMDRRKTVAGSAEHDVAAEVSKDALTKIGKP